MRRATSSAINLDAKFSAWKQMKVNNERLRAVNCEYLLNCDTKGVSLEQNVSMLSATYVIAKSIKEGGSQSRGIFLDRWAR